MGGLVVPWGNVEVVSEHLVTLAAAAELAHEALRDQASRYEAVRAVRETLSGDGPLDRRLEGLCEYIAGLLGDGIATVYLYDEAVGRDADPDPDLSHFPEKYRIA